MIITTTIQPTMSHKLIIPGDILPIDTEGSTKTSIGPGIYKNPKTHTIIPASAGLLNIKVNKKQTNQVAYIEASSKRYVPQANDLVVGIVVGVFGESYKLQLQDFSTTVVLSMMAFPNATKKNRPNLKVGQAVYARVSQAIPEVETELECVDSSGKEGGFGLLSEAGYIFDLQLHFARELLFNPNSIVLEKLAARCQFEIAIGINGKVWIKCGDGLVVDQTKESEKEDAEGDSKMKDAAKGNYIKDMKSTLSAAKYITRCQYITQEEIDKELVAAFK